jgi:RNA polymerase sigma-70 factor (ECF subfamily)
MPEEMPLRARQGAASAARAWLEDVFREYYAELAVFVCRYVGSDDVAEDILQDLFLSIWRAPERWIAAGDALRPLLFVAARNRAFDYMKHRRVHERYIRQTAAEGVEIVDRTADDELLYQEIRRNIDQAIAALPKRAREIFLLNREEGLTYREIADRLGLSIKTVENQMIRSLKKLRIQLSSYL